MLEDDDPAAACEAYGAAIERDPDLVDAYVNLGPLAHEAGRCTEAICLYELALPAGLRRRRVDAKGGRAARPAGGSSPWSTK